MGSMNSYTEKQVSEMLNKKGKRRGCFASA